MEEWSDVTALISNRPAAPSPSPEEELRKQEELAAATAYPNEHGF
jgi:hypothetical protein